MKTKMSDVGCQISDFLFFCNKLYYYYHRLLCHVNPDEVVDSLIHPVHYSTLRAISYK